MKSGVYCKSPIGSNMGVPAASRMGVMVLLLLTVVGLSGCEISPEQVKFRDQSKADATQAALCQGDDCPDKTGLKEGAGSSPVH